MRNIPWIVAVAALVAVLAGGTWILWASDVMVTYAQDAPPPAAAAPAAPEVTTRADDAAKPPEMTEDEKGMLFGELQKQLSINAQERTLQSQFQALEAQKTKSAAALKAEIAEFTKRVGPGWTIDPDTLGIVQVPVPAQSGKEPAGTKIPDQATATPAEKK